MANEGAIQEINTDHGSEALAHQRMLFEYFQNQTAAEKLYLTEQIKIERERTAFEKERADLKLQVKDMELEKEKANHRAEKTQWEIDRLQAMDRVSEVHRRESTAGIELDADEEERDSAIKKVHNPATKKNHPPVTKEKPKRWAPDGRSRFPKVCSTLWVNECPGVNLFPSDPIDTEPEVEESAPPRMLNGSDLIVLMANGIAEEANPASIMGIFYKGNPPSKRTLFDVSHIILEAYGVEADGFQYLCLVLYKNKARPMKYIASILYDYHILPRSITPEFIQGTGPDGAIIPMRHISIYKESQPTDDPVLAMLKKPSSKKWKWNANSK